MDDKWIGQQVNLSTQQWDAALTEFYPETKIWMSSPGEYVRHLTQECNYLRATKAIPWDYYLKENSTVLDLGCGGGWLSAFLSSNKRVKQITAVDSSQNYLNNYLPQVVEIMDGHIEKIKTVQGLFSPIIIESDSLDIVVISSAIHHADNLQGVMEECRRVLKKDGYLFILNETPSYNYYFIYEVTKSFIKILIKTIFRKYEKYSQKISSAGYLYDPYLGDCDYPLWYWEKSISESGLELQKKINSGLSTIGDNNDRKLTHFICKKI
jgi:ubiquinone/menaquinone biosynthesis C-methylase UbiE